MALVTVLWLVMLLSIIAAGFIETGRLNSRAALNLVQQAEAEALADAGVFQAVLELLEGDHRHVDGTPRSLRFENIDIRISIQDELGRIDLNTASEEIIRNLLAGAGAPPEAAASLADAIGDWRDGDDLRRLNGAEAEDYAAAGLPQRPRNGAFQSLAEAKLVLGMTPELFRRIEPALTIYSMRPSADPRTAPPQVLEAIYGEDRQRLDEARTERAAGPAALLALPGRAFTIRAEAALPGGAAFVRHAVVRFTGADDRPFWIHEWRAAARDDGTAAAPGELTNRPG